MGQNSEIVPCLTYYRASRCQTKKNRPRVFENSVKR